jgi:CelD/BcsL family acetyltransferase involved in cellulose biosynthesis
MSAEREIESHGDLDSIEQEWDDLALRVSAWPFLRPGWTRAWWRNFGDGELQVQVLRRNGNVAAVLPVARQGHLLRSPTTNWHTPVYGPVAEDGEAVTALLNSLLDQGPRRLELSFLDPDAPGLRQLRELATDYRLGERVVMRSPYVPLEGDWEGYFDSLSAKHRQSVRRRRRRLEEKGTVAIEVVDGGDRLGELLEECFRIEGSGWKGEEGTAIASSPETRSFYEEIAAWAAGVGLLRLAFLRLDGRGIAVNFSLEDESSHYLLKTGFDPELRSLGPGQLLLAEMIQRSFELGHKTYEFPGAARSYMEFWAEEGRDRFEAQLFAPSPTGHLDRAFQTKGLPAARRLRARLRR